MSAVCRAVTMNFLRKVGDAVGDALIGSESESESETDSEFERGIDEPGRTEESRSSTGENVDAVHGNREVEANKANEELDELVHSAMDFGRSTFEKLKHVSRGVGKELSVGLSEIKEQVREDFKALAENEGEAANDAGKTSQEQHVAEGVVYVDGDVILSNDGDESTVDALVQDKFEQVGEKIELFGQRMFVGAGNLLTHVKETTRDAIKETKDVIRESGHFVTRDVGKLRQERNDYECRVQAIQRDSGTYCDEPHDTILFKHFNQGFTMTAHEEEIANTMRCNEFVKELFARVVPAVVDRDTFWRRYFFKLYELDIEFGQRERPILVVEEETQQHADTKSDSCSPSKEGSHGRAASLGTDEEAFSSDSSSDKNNWTKIKQLPSTKRPESDTGSPKTCTEEGLNDSDIDEDWGLT